MPGSLEEELKNLGKKPLEETLRELDEGGDSLRDKLLRAFKDIVGRLRESEIIDYPNFHTLILSKLSEQKIVSDEQKLDTSITQFLSTYLKGILPLQKIYGARKRYVLLPSVTLSEEAQKDVDDLKEINARAEDYIKQHESKPKNKEFKEFVYSVFPDDLNDFDKEKIYRKLKSKYNIIEETKEKIMEKPEEKKSTLKEDIQRELEGIDLEKELGDY